MGDAKGAHLDTADLGSDGSLKMSFTSIFAEGVLVNARNGSTCTKI
jgi:hypothetical protein